MPNPAYTCNLLVISCIDFRTQPLVSSFIHKKFPGELYDYATCAGSVKNVSFAEEQIDIAVRLHDIQTVILIEHEDCGAYRKEDIVLEKQIEDLQKAKKTILKQYPHLEVQLFYLHISGVFEEIL